MELESEIASLRLIINERRVPQGGDTDKRLDEYLKQVIELRNDQTAFTA